MNREVYDRSIEFLKETVNLAKIEWSEKQKAFHRLATFATDRQVG